MSTVSSPLVLHVGDLLGRPGLHRDVCGEVVVPGLGLAIAGVAPGDPIDLELRLDAIPEGIVVSGAVSGRWQAECSRCLEPVVGPFDAEVHELYEAHPADDETYALHGDELDLTPLVRDVVLPQIPDAPLCDDDCRGLCPMCGIDRNVASCDCSPVVVDHRWDALGEIHFSDSFPNN